jgi:hypothetical protein
MRISSSERSPAALTWVLPATGTIALLAVMALRGFHDPFSIAAAGVAAVLAVVVLLDRAPVVAWWLVPISMSIFVPLPLQPYDLVLGALVGLAIVAWLRRPAHELRVGRIEIAYLLFLAGTLTTLLMPFDWPRWVLAIHMYGTGLFAFELARRGARRYGRAAILWGPLLFAAITTGMLALAARRIGSATTLLLKHRSEMSALPWGSTNYVAAVLVVILPGVLYLARDGASRPLERRIGLVSVAMILAGLVLTTSRGGLLLGAGYLLFVGLRGRRNFQVFAVGALVLVALLFATPFGRAIASRFTDPEQLPSVLIRFDIWHAAWDRGVSHLPFGVGYGQMPLQNDRLADYDPHDFYLSLFCEGGPLAVVLWAALMIALWRTSTLMQSTVDRPAARALRGTMILASLNALFEPTFSGNVYQALFWWMIGILEAGTSIPTVSPVRLVTEPADDTTPRPRAGAPAH